MGVGLRGSGLCSSPCRSSQQHRLSMEYWVATATVRILIWPCRGGREVEEAGWAEGSIDGFQQVFQAHGFVRMGAMFSGCLLEGL
jgi:hypothetical protein